MARKDELGRRGEQVAVRHLERAGWVILDRNWRCPGGEIDIVAARGSTLAIVEVKTRTTHRFGTPLEAVTPTKLARLRMLAGQWREAHKTPGLTVRIDVVSVTVPVDAPAIIEHFEAVDR